MKIANFWLSKSIFYVKNHWNLYQFFFSLKNTNLGAHFLLLTSFDYINFQITLLLKLCPIFDSSPLIQNSKFNSFLWVCWFLCKNLSNFVSPAWKLHDPYCHILYREFYHRITHFFLFIYFCYRRHNLLSWFSDLLTASR